MHTNAATELCIDLIEMPLQVCVAVLLDSFVRASWDLQNQERLKEYYPRIEASPVGLAYTGTCTLSNEGEICSMHRQHPLDWCASQTREGFSECMPAIVRVWGGWKV